MVCNGNENRRRVKTLRTMPSLIIFRSFREALSHGNIFWSSKRMCSVNLINVRGISRRANKHINARHVRCAHSSASDEERVCQYDSATDDVTSMDVVRVGNFP